MSKFLIEMQHVKAVSRASSAVNQEIVDTVNELAPKYFADDPMILAHFLAQLSHESMGFSQMEELGGPKYWAKYEGRKDLGNTKPGYGVKYHGRGLLQLTGYANYQRYGKKLGIDLVNNPELATRIDIGLQIAFEYWKERRIFSKAKANDVIAVTKAINGGTNGLADRKALTLKLINIMDAKPSLVGATNVDDFDKILSKGDSGPKVRRVQLTLSNLGYHVGLVDGKFGEILKQAVMKFQENNGLVIDGVVGQQTWDVLNNPDAVGFTAPESRAELTEKDLVHEKEPIAQLSWRQKLIGKIQTWFGIGTVAVGTGNATGFLDVSEWSDDVTNSVSHGRTILDVLGVSSTEAVIAIGVVFAVLGLVSWYVSKRVSSVNTENYKSGRTL